MNDFFMDGDREVVSGNFNRNVNLSALLPFLQQQHQLLQQQAFLPAILLEQQNLIVRNVEMMLNCIKVKLIDGSTTFVESSGRFRIEGKSSLSCRWALFHFLELICRRGITSAG
jgi:hypothetical protein